MAITAVATAIALVAFQSARAEREAEALTDEIDRQAAAAAAVAEEQKNLAGELTQTQIHVAGLTGEVDLLTQAHYRAAAGIKAQRIEAAKLRVDEARGTLDEARTAYDRRRRLAAGQAAAGPSADVDAYGRFRDTAFLSGDQRAVRSEEFSNLRTQTATTQSATAELRRIMGESLSAFTPSAAASSGNAAGAAGGAGVRRGGAGGTKGPSPDDLAAQREMLRLQGEIETLRAGGRTEAAAVVQRQVDVLNLTKQFAAAGIEDAKVQAQAQVDGIARAERLYAIQEQAAAGAKSFADDLTDHDRRRNEQLLERLGFEAEIARLTGDPQRRETAERELFIAERVNELLRDRAGLITETDRAAAEAQAGDEYDRYGGAELTGRVRDEMVAGLRDGLASLAEGDLAGVFTGLADRFTSRILDNLAEDLADIVMGAFKSDGGSGGTIISALGSLFGERYATGGMIRGAGTGTSDNVPIMASNGEFVMTAKATAAFRPLLEAMNKGRLHGFARGGLIATNEAGTERYTL